MSKRDSSLDNTEKRLKKIKEIRNEKLNQRRKKLFIIKSIAVLLLLSVSAAVTLYCMKVFDGKNRTDNNADTIENSESNVLDAEASEESSENLPSDSSSEEIASSEGPELPETINTEIKLSFVGDCMIASMRGKMDEGCLNWYADNYPTTYFFDKVRYIFEEDDFTIANCENVFTDRDIPEREKNWSPAFWFKSKAKNAAIFHDNSIEAVTVANNHTLDYGEEGAADTKKALEDAGVMWGENENILYLEKDGYTVAVVCVSLCGTKGGGGSYDAALNTLPYLETAKENSDFQVVYFHGGIEGSYEIPSWEKEACHMYVDNGADLVIGSHPHVLQPIEQYNGVEIVYSLGNFCFGGNVQPKNRTMIYQYTIRVVDDKIEAEESNIIPCYVYTGSTNNWQPAVIEDQDKIDRVMEFLNGERENPNE